MKIHTALVGALLATTATGATSIAKRLEKRIAALEKKLAAKTKNSK